APAKVNLTLHVTGQREDGYHTLDSLVMFADVGDHVRVSKAAKTTLRMVGPTAHNVPKGGDNLVLRAVIVKMSDPHAGGMMRCDVHVQLAGGAQPIIVEQSANDLYGAIDRAADRVQTCVRRLTNKARRHR
ncbi:MAG: HPF/RaiA family ribosome-associated protein, partial [Phycisphaerales bacterium JB050]